MFTTLALIATALAAFILGRLSWWPTIRRLRNSLRGAALRLVRDALTGLYNRDGLHAAHTLMTRTGQPGFVVLLDVDDFKTVNDTYGHDTGDQLLVIVADRIRETATLLGGRAARLAGDEYAALMPVRDTELARVADMFVTVVAQPAQLTTVDGGAVTITPTVSVGVAVVEPGDPLEAVLRRADVAMYHAKQRHGGNTYVIYEPGMGMPGTGRRGLRLRDNRNSGGEAKP